MTDHDRISRLEALLARVKARTDQPRSIEAQEAQTKIAEPAFANGATNGASHDEPHYLEAGQSRESIEQAAPSDTAVDRMNGLSRPDSVFPPESSTLHALPPPPPGSSAGAFVAAESSPRVDERPISKPAANVAPTSLEEAFEQYEMVQEVVEIAPDAEDDSVHLSVSPPIMLDEVIEEEAAARVRANEISDAPFSDTDGSGYANVPTPAEEFHSQQRLVVAPSSRPISGVDETELEILGEADLEEDLGDVTDVETDDLLARKSRPELDQSYGARPSRQAEEMIATILANGIEPPPENANRPVLELQEEDDEPPPSSRRPVSHELATSGTQEPHEQELTFDNDPPPPRMTPPPESGRQVALPDLSADSPDAFAASFSGVHEGSGMSSSVMRADLDDNSGVAVVVEPSAPAAAATFGELIDLALSI